MVGTPAEVAEAMMALNLYRAWGIRPHEWDAVPADVLRLTAIAKEAGLFGEES